MILQIFNLPRSILSVVFVHKCVKLILLIINESFVINMYMSAFSHSKILFMINPPPKHASINNKKKCMLVLAGSVFPILSQQKI